MRAVLKHHLWFLWVICLGLTNATMAQKDPDKIKYQDITINAAEGKRQFRTTNNLNPKIHTRTDRWYHWYHPHELHVSAGNFSGRLLDGDFTSYFKSGSLKEKGQFKKGLKTGEWMIWFENGKLSEVAEFKNGKRHGDYCSYDLQGNVMIKGVFKKDVYIGQKPTAWRSFVDFITFKKLRHKTPEVDVD